MDEEQFASQNKKRPPLLTCILLAQSIILLALIGAVLLSLGELRDQRQTLEETVSLSETGDLTFVRKDDTAARHLKGTVS